MRRSETSNFGFVPVMILLFAGLLLAVGGVMHAYVKNRQVEVAREIDKTKKRTDVHNEEAKHFQVSIDRKKNRHIIRTQLKEQYSSLGAIDPQAIEVIDSEYYDVKSVASSTH